MSKKFYTVSYDIEEDRVRNKIARLLKGFGERVQKSVYEVQLDEKQLEKLSRIVENLIGKEDSVRWYCLCENCQKLVKISGVGTLTKTPDVWIV